MLPVTGRSARWCYEVRLLRRLPRPIRPRPVTTSVIDIGSGMGLELVENVFSITEETAKLPDVRDVHQILGNRKAADTWEGYRIGRTSRARRRQRLAVGERLTQANCTTAGTTSRQQ